MSFDMMFTPMNIGTMTVKNRVVMTAAEFSLGQPNGQPTEKMINYFVERAKGEVGLIIPGICRVNDMGATSSFTQLSMARDANIEPMREMARRIHEAGAKLCIQLHHPGRQGYSSSINTLPMIIPIVDRFPNFPKTLFKATPLLLGMEQKKICMSMQAPSKCELSAHGAMRIHAMSNREVKKLINDFIEAALRCKNADVDAVELHGTHGYIIHQFLSPNTNRRTDEYGGSFENRMRFISEIITGIKEKCGKDYPLIVRMTADEMYDRIGKPGKGYGLEDGKKIAVELEKLGVDALNVSSACYDTYNYWLEPTSFEPGWRAYLAKEIKSVVNIPVIAANFIRSPEQAEKQLEDGYQDFVGSARNFIADPYWAKKAKDGHPEQIHRCIGCLHCIKSFLFNASFRGTPGECAVNPTVGIEKEWNELKPDREGKTAVVIGAGPAGLTAAVVLRRRGFDVTVYDKENKAGGQVVTAASGPLKDKLYWAIEDLLTECTLNGVKVVNGKQMTADEIAAAKPDAVIVATGGESVRPKSIKGIDSENVVTAPDVLLGRVEIKGKKVAVIGSGLTGLETTEKLNEDGNTVTVVEMADEIAGGKAWFQFVDDSMSRIEPFGTKFKLGTKLEAIEGNSIVVSSAKGKKTEIIPADFVVLAMGVRPVNALEKELKDKGINAVSVGDAAKGGTIGNATHDAFLKAMEI
ncbi:MAG: FAD-dependent oxidoreductase [Clostridiaceae bacterium]|nr:FAD-dependent oxidoreductase [Clostridiaceae bacterium]